MTKTPLFDEAFLRKLERLAILTRRAAAGQMQGERRSNRRGQSVEFADYRQYVRGDDFRRIDWNAYARLERFFIKLFVEEQELTVHFLLDNSLSMDWGEPNKLDTSRRAAAALGYIALLGLDRITVQTIAAHSSETNHRLPPLRGKRQAQTLFDYLQALGPAKPPAAESPTQNPRQSLSRQLAAYAANTPHPGPLLLFSDLMDDDWRSGVNALAGRGFELTVVHILSPDEINPELAGDFRLVDREDGRQVELSADFETLQRYRQHLSTWQAEWQRFCSVRNLNYIAISSALPLDDLLFTGLRRTGLLR